MNDLYQPTGKVSLFVYGEDGKLKEEIHTHNIVTSQGDGYISDLCASTPVRTKIISSGNQAYIVVGSGWTGTTPKSNTWVNVQVGSPNLIAAGYPQTQGVFPNSVLLFTTIFAAGSLSGFTINEAAIVSANAPGVSTTCLSYAQINPTATLGSGDTLVINWQICFLGA